MNIISNSFVAVLSKIIEVIIGIFSGIILMRILAPKDYGTFAIIWALNALFAGILDVGLTSSYIKSDNITKKLRDSFFTLNIVLGLITTLLFMITAPIVSKIYDNDELFYLITFFSLSSFISSLSLQHSAELTKEKKFVTLTNINIFSSLVGVSLSIWAAKNNWGVWTFNIGVVSRSIIYTLTIWFFSLFAHSIVNLKTIKIFKTEIIFGLKVFVGRLLNGIFNSIDKFVLGSMVSPEILGNYRSAQNYSRMTHTHLRMPIGSVIYTYIERYSAQNKKNIYNKFAIICMIITLMINGLLLLEGDLLFLTIFGPKWELAADYIKYFSIFSMGIVFKGIYTVIMMSEDKVNKINVFSSLSILILFIQLISFYLLEYSLLNFIIIFSGSIFTMWVIVLCIELKSITQDFQFTNYFFLCLIITILLRYVSEKVLLNVSSVNTIILAGTFELSLIIILYIYYKNNIRDRKLINV